MKSYVKYFLNTTIFGVKREDYPRTCSLRDLTYSPVIKIFTTPIYPIPSKSTSYNRRDFHRAAALHPTGQFVLPLITCMIRAFSASSSLLPLCVTARVAKESWSITGINFRQAQLRRVTCDVHVFLNPVFHVTMVI